MRQANEGALPVGDETRNDRLCGIITGTSSDFVEHLYPAAR